MNRRIEKAAMAIGLAAVIGIAGVSQSLAAKCGNNAAGFNKWVEQTKREAAAKGFSQRTINETLGNVSYRTKTIRLDRSQSSFKLSLNQFMAKRGANAIVAKGRRLKQQNQSLFNSLERKYGVPPGVLLAIWGMETGFGGYMGNEDTVSAVATLAYDCRRSQFFTAELYALMSLVERRELSRSQMRGAAHGELGHTQFLPSNYLRYAVDGDRNGRRDLVRSRTDALASTANYLKAHGWRRGGGYQPGQTNYRAIQAWNAASVYQQAIAIIAQRIDS
ncbi:lytic murein transglycosylase [Hoeflea sp. WL0058]|uniref:Lytic murein transglycosylase n=1 Tax=Flavimaribacter sediminis TaxID=2865987 RepID=A0AAE2ZP69_9HYPH|nr:lytic murein transglycosylase [Flavimaribacter sediminis]MBW8638370.1 lytic murein transglycosylase [Flavimaribacter sediminis]